MPDLSYLSLFASAFLSATLLPGSSEALLLYLMQDTDLSLLLLWLSATTGNVLGSVANWGLGRFGYHLRHRRWFPVAEAQLERARGYFLRWGSVSLLLAWLPVVGDPLTLLAGLLRVPFVLFLVLVTLGKGLRYALLIGVLS
ncbi:YqaA family protein [Oceanospirillum beijerinckii]|uniref:YqaA family protein n=1 Tax=Oceanospirillum beijerinckii TaxID=64976 RepID=UPI00041416AE|nr:YqaA family protein [Oceanospirillum beijerinckii]